MPIIQLYASVTETGILTIPNRKRLQADLLKFKGCSIELTIKKKNRRSSPQNRYYHGVVVKEIEIRLRELGNDVNSEVVHEFLKHRFNQKHLLGDGGEIIDSYPGSTTEMNRFEFSEYVEKIAQWACEFLGLYIPAPNEDLQLKF